jgi:predicted permease
MRWYQRLFRRARTERQLDEELRFHLEQQVSDYVASGMTPEEARRRARLEFGGLDQVKEECRDVGAARFVEALIQDVRYGLRQLRRNPGFTVLAVLALALGMGANAGIFSLAEAVLFPRFAGAQPSRLAAIYTSGENRSGYASSSFPDYVYYRDHTRAFSSIAAYACIETAWTQGHATELSWGEIVSSNYFDTLGIKPFRGRFFLPSESYAVGQTPVAVVSYNFWRRHMASTPQLSRHPFMLNGQLFTVVGVAPQGFEGVQLDWGGIPNFWVPMNTERMLLGPRSVLLENRQERWCLMVGRLDPGVTLARSAGEIRLLAKQLSRAYEKSDKGRTAFVMPFNEGRIWPAWRQKISTILWLLSFFAGLVLLVACADVANLFLGQGAARQKEIGVRLALGASRARVIRQLLTESLLVSLAGAGVGLLMARWMAAWFSTFRQLITVRLTSHPAALDARVLGFTLVLSVLTAVGSGLAPAFQTSRLDLNSSLKEFGPQASPGGRRQRLRHSLVVAEICVAFVGVAGAAILLHTLWKLDSTNLGLDPHHVLSVSTEVFTLPYKTVEQRTRDGIRFYSQLLGRVQTLPDVRSAALA